MITVPIQPNPNQTLQIVLNNQNCQINLFQSPDAMFMDLYVNDSPVIVGVICQNLNRIVRSLYLGFSGDFIFNDTQGTTDPVYTGLGSRYVLIYLSPSDLDGNG